MSTLMLEFMVRESRGIIDLFGFFPGKRVKIDKAFHELALGENGDPDYSCGELKCRLFEGSTDDIQMAALFGAPKVANSSRLCSILRYLGNEGESLLDIPAGADRKVVIVGYLYNRDWQPSRVIFVEHEFQQRVEQFCLRVRTLSKGEWQLNKNKWRAENPPAVLVAE